MVNQNQTISSPKKWVCLSGNVSIPEGIDVPEEIIKILGNRGVMDDIDLLNKQEVLGAINNFLNPDFKTALQDPFLLSDMKKAVDRILEAIEKKEKIAIYGDYDVDGVTSAALLDDILDKLKANHSIYIPSRFDEGYGLNQEAIEKLKKEGAQLIITVDCGIRSFEEVKVANELGIDVIITDHHEIKRIKDSDVLPEALAVINPKREDSKYPFKEFAGVGVAFKLATAILENLEKSGKLEIRKDYLKWLLDLVALGTICDVAPLVDENRTLVYYGMIVLKRTKRVGIKALAEAAAVDIENINVHNVGFHLGPRLNAAGRLEHAKISFDLLASKNKSEAEGLAKEVNKLNQKRQEITARIIEEAREALDGKQKESLILLKGKDWPAGVVGIVASRLVEECGKPVLILEEGAVESVGSARSVGKFDIVEALKKCDEFLVKYGGHKRAAGLTVKNEHFILLNEKLISIANEEITEEDLILEIGYDTDLKLSKINDEFYSYLEKLSPFGFGNKTPLFLIENVLVEDLRMIGKEKNHAKIAFKNGASVIEGMFFSFQNDDNIQRGDKLDLVASITMNEWMGRKKLELIIVDLKKCDEN